MICCKKSNNSFSKLAKSKIGIYSISQVKDGVRGFTTEEVLLSLPKAIIEPRNGVEVFQFSKNESKVNAYIYIRYIEALSNTALGAKYFIKFKERKYNIIAVLNHDDLYIGAGSTRGREGKKFQKIICTENEAV